jgi:hypothetical protein
LGNVGDIRLSKEEGQLLKTYSKGKLGSDGVTRYYVPSQHAWKSLEQIAEEKKADETAVSIDTVVGIVVVVGALLFMVIVGLSSS